MRDASYARGVDVLVPPVTLEMESGARVAQRCGDAREARTLALMASALARPTSGTVVIGEYDPRVQPVHCKRIVGFVPHDPLPLWEMSVSRFIEYRAALWDMDVMRARSHADVLLERLRGVHEAFAYPIVAALLPFPLLLVLDRPQATLASLILDLAGSAAVFSTHLDDPSAHAFSPEREAVIA